MPDFNLRCFCADCEKYTRHKIIANHVVDVSCTDKRGHHLMRHRDHMIVECFGCGNIHFLLVKMSAENLAFTIGYDHPYNAPFVQEVYPIAFQLRRPPEWLYKLDDPMKGMLRETYIALNIRLNRMAAMGSRATLEAVINATVGDQGSFQSGVSKLIADGFLAENSKSVVLDTLDVGSAVTHRGFDPDQDTILRVVEIIENVIHAIIVSPQIGEAIKSITPQRSSRTKGTSQ